VLELDTVLEYLGNESAGEGIERFANRGGQA
jgi:hypothetical protein